MVKTITVIYGCHGSGKTTLVKNIIGEEFTEIKLRNGIVSRSKDGKFVAIGPYHNKTGGTDSVKSINNTFLLLSEAINYFPYVEHILIEGIFLSSVISKPLKAFINIKHGLGIKIEMVLLRTSAETSLRRVFGRNNKVPNCDNIIQKVKRVVGVFQKIAESGEFDCYLINTDHLTAKQVFDSFKAVSACFRR